MLIAVSAKTPDEKSEIDPRFGRAAYFAIYDTEADNYKFVENTQNLQAAHGAGIQTGQMIAENKVEWVVSSAFGPKAYSVLAAAGIKAATYSDGNIADAIKLVMENKLQPVDKASVQGHW